MSGFFKAISNFILYKEPKNAELGFELLEDGNESKNQERKPNSSGSDNMPKAKLQQKNPTQARKNKSDKTPLTIPEWNKNRKTENTHQTLNNSDEISRELCVNLETIKQKFLLPKNQDIIIREFRIGRKIKAFIAHMEGMVDKQTLNLSIFPQLMDKEVFDGIEKESVVDYLLESVLTVYKVRKTNKYNDVIMDLLSGASALFTEGCNECILMETKGFEKRNIEKPVTETVIKGPQEGFTENLRTNITLVRRIIKNENLVTEMLSVGNTNHANCAVIYLDGVANPKVIQEVKKRLKKINTDFILGDGMVEQFIEDNPFSLFPQVLSTERPDRTTSFIMEGQVVIIVDGSPFALTVPVTFYRLFHTSEDMSLRWPLGSFLRLVRLFGLFCATLLPGMYVAVTLFHIEMLPTELLHSMAMSKESVPFPTLIEVLIMEISFELIREGGIRVPGVIGQTIGIVGALILGQAAVGAGLVSPILVIIVAVTGLGSFAIPNYTLSMSIRIERFLFIFAGAFLGFYGISLVGLILAYQACSMKSFGVPFFTPVAPRTEINPDVILRYPIWMQKNRPDTLNTQNRKRQGDNQKVWIDEKNQGNKGGGEEG